MLSIFYTFAKAHQVYGVEEEVPRHFTANDYYGLTTGKRSLNVHPHTAETSPTLRRETLTRPHNRKIAGSKQKTGGSKR